jgi:hypothetical protein
MVPRVHCVQAVTKAALRHHHVNVVWEYALYEFEIGAAFVAAHALSYLICINSFVAVCR